MAQIFSTRTILIMTAIILAIVLLVCPEEALAQCSMCKLALEASGKDRLILGFKWSIAFMVTPPLLMTAGVGFLVLRSGRNQAEMNEAESVETETMPSDEA